jgi:hypothetical protein
MMMGHHGHKQGGGHAGGMGCGMRKGGMEAKAGPGADGDEAFHRELVQRLNRIENRMILLETLLRERLRTP